MTRTAKPQEKKVIPGYIKSLTGLKAIAMLLIFWQHAPIKNPPIDLGARMCELLFICSGFLIGYKYLSAKIQKEATWQDSFRYLKKKALQLYPIHIICTIIVFLFLGTAPIFSGESLIRLIFNLLFMQSWMPGSINYFSFNGVTWFVSSLLFCYFCSPFMCQVAKKAKRPLLLLLITCGIRILLELIPFWFPGKFYTISFHVFPPIRALEFFIGILTAPVFMSFKKKIFEKVKHKCLLASLLEVITLTSIIILMIHFNGIWHRGTFVSLFLPPIFVFALDSGIISKILSIKPFMLFSKVQLYFFFMHWIVIRIVAITNILGGIRSRTIKTAIIFLIILAASTLFYLITNKISNYLKKRKAN